MIHHLKGRLVEKTPAHAVIECGGVGYFVNISLNTFTQIPDKEECKLLTHLAVREDAHTLYGFIDEGERTMFRHLISVSGVGASTARMILSSLTPAELQGAIVQGDTATLKSIKGIGGKSAERIIVDLRDKIGKEALGGDATMFTHNSSQAEALTALVALGFTKNTAEKALQKTMKEEGNNMEVAQLIKAALKHL